MVTDGGVGVGALVFKVQLGSVIVEFEHTCWGPRSTFISVKVHCSRITLQESTVMVEVVGQSPRMVVLQLVSGVNSCLFAFSKIIGVTVHSMSILVPLIHVVPVGVGNVVAKCIPVRTSMGALPPNLPCRSTIGAIVGVGATVRGGANLPLRWIGAAGILIPSVYCKLGELNEDDEITFQNIFSALKN
jgi:hypothetical protein